MPRHLVQNPAYVFLAKTTEARDEILKSHFLAREITNDEFNQQLEATGDVPDFQLSQNFDAYVWERGEHYATST